MSPPPDLSTITAISFDGDATLWDFETMMRRALERTREELLRLRPSDAIRGLSVEDMVRIRQEIGRELKGVEINLERVRLIAFQRTLEYVGIHDDDLADHLNEFYREHRFSGVELYPDTLPTLDALAGRYKIGLVSNGNSYPEKVGLAGRFEFVLFAQDCGFAKPDARIFDAALAQAACSRDELLHVGDSLADDVQGARNAGVRSVWLNRAGAANDTDIEPDHEIATLTELCELVQS